MKYLVIICFLFLNTSLLMAQLPTSNILLIDYLQTKKKLKIYNPKLLTFHNHKGYNNQPTFVLGELYYTQSSMLNDTVQTDIFSLDIKNKIKTRITKTSSSEYSPTLCPDGIHFSVIRAEKNGDQLLWKLPLNRKGYGSPIFKDIKNVGYHCWLNEKEVALFLVNEEKDHQLVIGDVETGKIFHIAYNVGRCFKKMLDGRLVYLQKNKDSIWKIKAMNIKTGVRTDIADAFPNKEDFDFLPDGSLITAFEGYLYKIKPFKELNWQKVANLNSITQGKTITRIAIHNGKIAFVVK